MNRKLGSVDLETDEILQGVPVWVGVKYSPYGNRWFMANQDALLAIASNKELTLEPYRVLMVLFGKLDFENWISAKKSYSVGRNSERVMLTDLTRIMAGKARAKSCETRDSH